MTADSEQVQARDGRWQSLRRFVDPRLRVFFVAASGVTVLSLFGRLHWTFDNLTSFVVQYAIVGFLFLIAFLLLRRPAWAAAAVILVGVNLIRFWPIDISPIGATGEPIRVVSANVKTTNRQFDRFTRFVRAASPDVLLVIEIDDDWAEALDELRRELPHAVVVPRIDNFGIALLSRLPFDETDVVEFGDAGLPTIVARLTHDGRRLTILGTHPFPPVRSGPAAMRNRQFAGLARFARAQTGEVVLIGDLNVSPWSPHFGDLIDESGLSDSRQEFWPQPTWPSFFPPAMTPIDHLLVSDGVAVLDRRVGTDVGSDHRPVVADIAFQDRSSKGGRQASRSDE